MLLAGRRLHLYWEFEKLDVLVLVIKTKDSAEEENEKRGHQQRWIACLLVSRVLFKNDFTAILTNDLSYLFQPLSGTNIKRLLKLSNCCWN